MNEDFILLGNIVFDLFALGIIFAVVSVAKVSAYYQESGWYE